MRWLQQMTSFWRELVTILIMTVLNKTLFLFYLKICSLRRDHDELKVFPRTLTNRPALIALCETWMTDNGSLELYTLTGYQKIKAKNRKNKGGLAFFVIDDISYILIDCQANIETLCIEIEAGKIMFAI